MVDRNRAPRFALLGVAGFVAPRHLEAIQQVGGQLLATADPHDSVGILDRYFPHAHYFRSERRFEEFLARSNNRPHYLSICTPNDLHVRHLELALRLEARAICEKPLAFSAADLDRLNQLSPGEQARIFSILQLRFHPLTRALRHQVQERAGHQFDVELTYHVPRGSWYQESWKGELHRSGGLLANIGIHLFDMLLWVFGEAKDLQLEQSSPRKAAGELTLERARVRWSLSTEMTPPERAELGPGTRQPSVLRSGASQAHRRLVVDGRPCDFSDGFSTLHTQVYKAILHGTGTTLLDALPALHLVLALQNHKGASLAGAGLGVGSEGHDARD